jgi:hypothetical protein
MGGNRDYGCDNGDEMKHLVWSENVKNKTAQNHKGRFPVGAPDESGQAEMTSETLSFSLACLSFLEIINETARLSHDLSRFFIGKVGIS